MTALFRLIASMRRKLRARQQPPVRIYLTRNVPVFGRFLEVVE